MCASRGHPAVARKAAAGRRCCPLTGANRGIRLLDATNEYCERPRTSLQWIAVPDHNIGVLAYIQRPRSVRDSPDARRIVQVRLHRRPVAGFGIGRFTTYRQPPPSCRREPGTRPMRCRYRRSVAPMTSSIRWNSENGHACAPFVHFEQGARRQTARQSQFYSSLQALD